jgi:hypothetical protein
MHRPPKMGTSYFSYVKLNYIPSDCPTMIIWDFVLTKPSNH